MTLHPTATTPADRSIEDADTRPGPYFVTVIDGARTGFLAGPFRTHAEALAMVPAAKRIAMALDPRAVFYAFGTVRWKDPNTPAPTGKLNGHLVINDYRTLPMDSVPDRFPRLLRAMRWTAALSQTEAVNALWTYVAARNGALHREELKFGGGEAVSHFGGPELVITSAARCANRRASRRSSGERHPPSAPHSSEPIARAASAVFVPSP